MPKLYNLDHQHAIYDADKPGIAPGESHDFTDEEAAALSGSWSETDPRAGLADEQTFKLARDTSRADLDEQATALGVDPTGLPTKQAVAEAIQAALAAQAQSIEDVAADAASDNPNPAESGEKE